MNRGGKRATLTDAAESEGLLETAHLLRSPRNAERLWLALDQARRGEGLEMSGEELRSVSVRLYRALANE
ncbi:MAG: hypothetical protein ACREMY_32395 [bacterium]